MKRVQKNVLDKFCESKGIARIYKVPYSPQHQRAVKVFSRAAQNSLPHQKITKGKYDLEESYNDFLIY